MFEERLIKEVQKYPCIYNKGTADFRNKIKKEIVWAAIAKVVEANVHQCRGRWKSLRDRYVKEVCKRESGCSTQALKWRYLDEMSFMKVFVIPTTTRPHIKSAHECAEEYFDEKPFSIKDFGDNIIEGTHILDSRQFTPFKSSYVEENCTPIKRQKVDDIFKNHKTLIETIEDIVSKKLSNESRNSSFYKVVESYLSKVNDSSQDDIKIEILNLVSQRVKDLLNK